MIKYIEYKGKKLPFKFSYYALSRFQADTNLSINSLSEPKNLIHFETLMYYALEAGHKLEGLEFTITKEDVAWMFDENENLLTIALKNAFPKQTSKKEDTTDTKKK